MPAPEASERKNKIENSSFGPLLALTSAPLEQIPRGRPNRSLDNNTKLQHPLTETQNYRGLPEGALAEGGLGFG